MKQENNCALPQEGAFRTTIGGQALIEGILMRGPEKQAIVVRNQEGELEVKEQTLKLIKDRYPILGLPFLRGVVNFLASLVEGVKALMWSAEFYPDEEEEKPPSKFETWLEKHFGSEGLMKWVIGFSVVVGIAFAIALFIILPTLATSALLYFFPDAPHVAAEPAGGCAEAGDFFPLSVPLLPAEGHSPDLSVPWGGAQNHFLL